MFDSSPRPIFSTFLLQAPAKDTLKVAKLAPTTSTSTCHFRGSTLSVNGDMVARCRAPSVGIDTDLVSEFDPSSSDSGVVSRCAVVKPLKLRLCQPIFGGRRSKGTKRQGTSGGGGGGAEIVVAPPQKPRDPEREKRRIARKKEKRATLILGLIMGSFIACWLPFFFLYILTPMCPQCDIPARAFATAFWLGYTNSALNPVIYTIFNKDFRRAFRRILFKWCLFVVCCCLCARLRRRTGRDKPEKKQRSRWWTKRDCALRWFLQRKWRFLYPRVRKHHLYNNLV